MINTKYFVAVIGKGENSNRANLYFLKNTNNNFKLILKSPCWIGKNGWVKRSEGDKKNTKGIVYVRENV
jgi:hypothetical protein